MKKLFIFMGISTFIFGIDLFSLTSDVEKNVQLNSKKITELLEKEVKQIELENTTYKIVNTEKFNKSGLHNTDTHGEIKVENAQGSLSSMTYKLKKNIWYFIKTNEDSILKFFEYNSNDKALYDKNNFYIKLLDNKTNVLFKTKFKFEPITIEESEELKFVVMGDDLKQQTFTLSRVDKEQKNEK